MGTDNYIHLGDALYQRYHTIMKDTQMSCSELMEHFFELYDRNVEMVWSESDESKKIKNKVQEKETHYWMNKVMPKDLQKKIYGESLNPLSATTLNDMMMTEVSQGHQNTTHFNCESTNRTNTVLGSNKIVITLPDHLLTKDLSINISNKINNTIKHGIPPKSQKSDLCDPPQQSARNGQESIAHEQFLQNTLTQSFTNENVVVNEEQGQKETDLDSNAATETTTNINGVWESSQDNDINDTEHYNDSDQEEHVYEYEAIEEDEQHTLIKLQPEQETKVVETDNASKSLNGANNTDNVEYLGESDEPLPVDINLSVVSKCSDIQTNSDYCLEMTVDEVQTDTMMENNAKVVRDVAINIAKSTAITENGETVFSCNFCPYKTAVLARLRRHITVHTGKEFKCSYCSKAYTERGKLAEHVKVKHEKSVSYPCPLCSKVFTSKRGLIYHNITIHEERGTALKCSFCPKVFSSRYGFVYHTKTVHGESKVEENKAKTNALVPMSQWGKSSHRKICKYPKDSDGMYSCQHCDYKTTRLCHIKRHASVHSGHTNYCDQCEKTFSDPYKLRLHIQVKHGNLRYDCDVCKKEFGTREGLKYHKLSSHGGEWKFVCDVCGHGFYNKTLYEGHRNKHKGIRAYSCKDCGKEFFYQSDVYLHKKHCGEERVIKEKPDKYICHVCGDEFKKKQVLTEHVNGRHGIEGIYNCVCGASFKWRNSLRQHKQKCTKIKEIKDDEHIESNDIIEQVETQHIDNSMEHRDQHTGYILNKESTGDIDIKVESTEEDSVDQHTNNTDEESVRSATNKTCLQSQVSDSDTLVFNDFDDLSSGEDLPLDVVELTSELNQNILTNFINEESDFLFRKNFKDKQGAMGRSFIKDRRKRFTGRKFSVVRFPRGKRRQHTCSGCGKKFVKWTNYKRHSQICHRNCFEVRTAVEMYVCGFCDGRFSKKSHLAQHIQIHMPINKFVRNVRFPRVSNSLCDHNQGRSTSAEIDLKCSTLTETIKESAVSKQLDARHYTPESENNMHDSILKSVSPSEDCICIEGKAGGHLMSSKEVTLNIEQDETNSIVTSATDKFRNDQSITMTGDSELDRIVNVLENVQNSCLDTRERFKKPKGNDGEKSKPMNILSTKTESSKTDSLVGCNISVIDLSCIKQEMQTEETEYQHQAELSDDFCSDNSTVHFNLELNETNKRNTCIRLFDGQPDVELPRSERNVAIKADYSPKNFDSVSNRLPVTTTSVTLNKENDYQLKKSQNITNEVQRPYGRNRDVGIAEKMKRRLDIAPNSSDISQHRHDLYHGISTDVNVSSISTCTNALYAQTNCQIKLPSIETIKQELFSHDVHQSLNKSQRGYQKIQQAFNDDIKKNNQVKHKHKMDRTGHNWGFVGDSQIQTEPFTSQVTMPQGLQNICTQPQERQHLSSGPHTTHVFEPREVVASSDLHIDKGVLSYRLGQNKFIKLNDVRMDCEVGNMFSTHNNESNDNGDLFDSHGLYCRHCIEGTFHLTCPKKKDSYQFKCPFCDERFRTNEYLREHMLGLHGTHRRYTCSCGSTFKWRSSLACHKKRCGSSLK